MKNTHRIMYILSLIFVTAILFLYMNIYVIFPSVSDLVVKNTQKEAVLATRLISSMNTSEGEVVISDPADIEQSVIRHKKEFGFEKIKVFSADGTVVYSTDPKDIGDINKRDYFVNNVANGERSIQKR